MNSKSEILLKEYVKNTLQLIKEQEQESTDFGGYYGASYGGARSAAEVSPGGLMDTFITPFTDVFKTAVAATKEITTDAASLLRVSFRAAISTILPFIGARYDDIFEERDKRIAKIRDENRDVYERTSAALGSGDAKLFGFMFSPGLFLGGATAFKSPSATKSLLSVATGGISDSALEGAKKRWEIFQEKTLSGEKYKDKKNKEKLRAEENDIWKQLAQEIESGRSRKREQTVLRHSLIHEEKDKLETKEDKEFLKAALSSAEVKQAFSRAIKESEAFQNYFSDMLEVEKQTLKKAQELANQVIKNTRSLEDVEKLVKDSKGKEAINKLKIIKDPKQKQQQLDILVKNIKASAKQTFMATLSARKSLFPKDSPAFKLYQDAIDKLNAL